MRRLINEPTTILILSHNRSWSLLQVVSSIRQWTRIPYHIVIQDHNSDGRHWPVIQSLHCNDCTVLRCDRFLSCNEGRRLGLDHVTGQHVVFLDDDIRVQKEWLRRLMFPMLKYRNVGAVCGQLVQNFGQERMCWGRELVDGQALRLKYGYTGWSQFCGGGATLYDVTALRETQFRAEYNGTGEDWDQLLQMHSAGWRCFCTDVQFFHFHQDDYEEYGAERWRFTEIMDSAIALYKYWGIKTVVVEQAAEMVKRGLPFQPHQKKVIKEVCGI